MSIERRTVFVCVCVRTNEYDVTTRWHKCYCDIILITNTMEVADGGGCGVA